MKKARFATFAVGAILVGAWATLRHTGGVAEPVGALPATPAGPPIAPFSTLASTCSTFTAARFAVEVVDRNPTFFTSGPEGSGISDFLVLRIAGDGRAAVDQPGIRHTWHPGGEVTHDHVGQAAPDVNWTLKAHVNKTMLEDLWASCRTGFADLTWGTPVQAPNGWSSDVRVPYTWGAGLVARVHMKGSTADSLDHIYILTDTTPQKEVTVLNFTITEWNITLVPNALNADMSDTADPPRPWVWHCTLRSPDSCWERTGWAPPGTPTPLME